jgi:hypothetical protein
MKQITIIFSIALIISSCNSNNATSNKATKEETEDWISEKLTTHSRPWNNEMQMFHDQVYFRNDSLIIEEPTDWKTHLNFTNLSTKNKYIGEVSRINDSTLLIKYLDRPWTGIPIKIIFSTEKDLDKRLIEAFDHLKSFYKNSENF